jgi:hypothetical protein
MTEPVVQPDPPGSLGLTTVEVAVHGEPGASERVPGRVIADLQAHWPEIEADVVWLGYPGA